MIALLLALAAPQAAAPPAPAAIAAPDAARLAAARRLVDVSLPPAQREAMMRGIIAPTVANMRAAFEQDPAFARGLAGDPRAKALLLQFIERQTSQSMDEVVTNFPTLIDAMTRAYARRFTVAQLDELSAFYRSPTGQAFVTQMPTLMSDPDIQAAQRTMMTAALSRVQRDAQALSRQMAALPKTTDKQDAPR